MHEPSYEKYFINAILVSIPTPDDIETRIKNRQPFLCVVINLDTSGLCYAFVERLKYYSIIILYHKEYVQISFKFYST